MPKRYVLLIASFLVLILMAFQKEVFILLNRSGYENTKRTGVFHGMEFKVPEEMPAVEQVDNVLGSSSKEKRIEINLTEQELYAFEGDKKVMDFDVSTGKWGRTPTGEFRIWIKLRYTLMAGGSKELGTYYYLPNVPFTMYFYKDFGIHGAYWHDNFGHPMSHGCINMRPEEAEKLFYWASPSVPDDVNSILSSSDNEGTKVIIYGVAPNE